jgi:hypothetical protein
VPVDALIRSEAADDDLGRRRWRGSLALETPALTAAFWLSVALYTLAFWAGPFPPLIDYPQHVAVGALLHRMADPSAP